MNFLKIKNKVSQLQKKLKSWILKNKNTKITFYKKNIDVNKLRYFEI